MNNLKSLVLSCLLLIGVVQAQLSEQELAHLQPAQLVEITKLREERDAALAKAEELNKAYLTKISALTGVPQPVKEEKAKALYEFAKSHQLKVRRTLKEGKENTQPALFQYTHPSDGNDSWSSDIGLSFGKTIPGLPVDWALMGEYHYNTLAKALSDSLLAGGRLGGLIGDVNRLGAEWVLDASYKRDNLVAGEGFLAGLNLFPAIPSMNIGGIYFPIGKSTDYFNGRLEPSIGAEFESGNGASDKFRGGERVSLRAGLSLNGVLFPRYFGQRIELSNSLSYWGNVSTSGFYDSYDDNQLLYVGSLTYWLNSLNPLDESGILQKHFGITIRYVNGNNPIEGAFDQNVWTFGFSIQF